MPNSEKAHSRTRIQLPELDRLTWVLVAVALVLACASGIILAGPRVYYAMSRDGVFFQRFARVSKFHHTPAYSIILQAAIDIGGLKYESAPFAQRDERFHG